MGLKSTKKVPNAKHHNALKKVDLLPGENFSTDQYKCMIRVRLPYTRGKEDPQKMFAGGTLFVEYVKSYINIYYHVSLGATDTVCSKNICEL